uniref:ABC transporter ATP-binding protein n=1 Tax=Heterorhabditis bacteriophora TaxID=37862 RepID=A0A1I7XNI0_HETBA
MESIDRMLAVGEDIINDQNVTISKEDGSLLTEGDEVSLTNNAPMFLFDRATYYMDGVQLNNEQAEYFWMDIGN